MKRFNCLLPVACCLLAISSCDVRRKDKIDTPIAPSNQLAIKDSTTVKIIDTAYDFGKVADGDVVQYSFRFQNTGSNPLIISNAAASCGCTVPEKPEEPIQPGDTGYIRVKFDSKGRVGMAHKTIDVYSNANPGFPTLLLQGEVTATE